MGTVAVPSHAAAGHTKIEGSGHSRPRVFLPQHASPIGAAGEQGETAADSPRSQTRKDYETSEEESVCPLPTTS